jgi:hypothetical protein
LHKLGCHVPRNFGSSRTNGVPLLFAPSSSEIDSPTFSFFCSWFLAHLRVYSALPAHHCRQGTLTGSRFETKYSSIDSREPLQSSSFKAILHDIDTDIRLQSIAELIVLLFLTPVTLTDLRSALLLMVLFLHAFGSSLSRVRQPPVAPGEFREGLSSRSERVSDTHLIFDREALRTSTRYLCRPFLFPKLSSHLVSCDIHGPVHPFPRRFTQREHDSRSSKIH